MYFKVKITKGLPQAKSGGFTGNNLNKQVISFGGADMNAASRHLENTRYLKQVPRDEANLEAEKGESAFGDINGDGFPEHMLIGGKRHSNGGTPLNLPDGTFIFSDTASMKIKDPKILAKFGKKSGSFTPAELAKPYDINKYRKILEDPNSDKVDKKSAELMIKNINMKLGALAIAQESKKGFPQGIPEVAKPYMEAMGIKEEDLIPQKPQAEAQVNSQAMQNPYENQGMGAQSSEEESVEQVQGMQNPQEESMESPMGRYGFQMGRRLRVAQEGMEQGQPSSEEMAMMQQQGAPQQQGGSDPLAQIVQQVQQMLQQGAQPADVVMQLLQKQVPPQAIMQILVQVGMPQEEAQATIQEVMQQGQQNPQEEMAEGSQGQNPQEEMMEAPMAQYGMSMGGYGMPFHDTQYRDGGSLNRFDGGGSTYSIPKDAIVIDRSKYKTDAEYEVGRNLEFAKAGTKPVYILYPDGKYKKVTQKTKAKDPYTGTDLGPTFNNSADAAIQFREMGKSINTPEFTNLLAEYTLKAIKDESKYKNSNKITSKAFADFSKQTFTPAEIKEAFIQHQKRNIALQSHGIQARYFENASTGRLLTPEQIVSKKIMDKGKPVTLAQAKEIVKKYKTEGITDLNKAFDKVGIPLGNTALEQATFQGFTDAIKNKANLTPAQQKTLENWGEYESGVADETGQINNQISPIDRVYTNTTGEQLSQYTPTEYDYTEDDVEPIDRTADATEEEDTVYPPTMPAQPWAQDKLNRLNAGLDYFSAEKYLPWAASYNPEMLDPTFYDPTRELAAQSEQANITNQALGQFMGAQDLSARAASIQGQGAKQAADILGRYNNLNVGLANQFAGNNTQIRNEAQRYNQGLNKQLYDQNVIGNQQFDNTKRALRHNLGDAENTLLTNMYKTDAVNQLTPQYAIDTSVGGKMHFTGPKPIKPTTYKDYLATAKEIQNADLDPELKKILLNDHLKRSRGDVVNSDAESVLSQYGKKGGSVEMAYVMGSNVFPFMFT
jgi:ribosomal protein S16